MVAGGTRLDEPLFTRQEEGFGEPKKYRKLLRTLAVALTCVVLPLLGLLAKKQGRGIDSQGLPNRDGGYWAPQTSNVNWCEEDYVVTRYIAEFWNSVSSLGIVANGLYGLWSHPGCESRFKAAFLCIVVVGFGSFGFHATLLRSLQLMDELPMVWGNHVFIYILLCMNDLPGTARPWLPWGLLALATAMTVAIVKLDTETQDVFLLCYGGGATWITVQSFRLNAKYNAEAVNVLQEMSYLSYLGGLLVWLVDRNFCPQVRQLYLHSFWHFGAGCGTYSVTVLWVWLRHRAQGKHAEVKGSYPTYYVEAVHEKV